MAHIKKWQQQLEKLLPTHQDKGFQLQLQNFGLVIGAGQVHRRVGLQLSLQLLQVGGQGSLLDGLLSSLSKLKFIRLVVMARKP